MRKISKVVIVLIAVLLIGYLIPQHLVMPVKGANSSSYNSETFWYYPWGSSVTHKGVDIFAKSGTPVISATGGIVLYSGTISKGGNVILVLGPKWRLHYYAHLQSIDIGSLSFTGAGEQIGTVGSSGNAAGKPPHLHYSIVTPIPYVWRADNDRQGWKKMFYLNPIDYFNN